MRAKRAKSRQSARSHRAAIDLGRAYEVIE